MKTFERLLKEFENAVRLHQTRGGSQYLVRQKRAALKRHIESLKSTESVHSLRPRAVDDHMEWDYDA